MNTTLSTENGQVQMRVIKAQLTPGQLRNSRLVFQRLQLTTVQLKLFPHEDALFYRHSYETLSHSDLLWH